MARHAHRSSRRAAWRLLYAALARRGDLINRFGGLALVPAGFAIFVVHNGGVAVGDKDAHRPVLHFAQLLYFCSCSLGFLAPLLPYSLMSTLRAAVAAPRRSALAAGALCAACFLAAHRSTLVHPYILADNRHSTFYLWRHLLGRGPWVRYALVPGHALAAASVGGWATAKAPPLVALAWALATAATLVPAHLVELRYFNIPFLLLCAHGPPWTPAQSTRASLCWEWDGPSFSTLARTLQFFERGKYEPLTSVSVCSTRSASSALRAWRMRTATIRRRLAASSMRSPRSASLAGHACVPAAPITRWNCSRCASLL